MHRCDKVKAQQLVTLITSGWHLPKQTHTPQDISATSPQELKNSSKSNTLGATHKYTLLLLTSCHIHMQIIHKTPCVTTVRKRGRQPTGAAGLAHSLKQ